MKTIQEQIEVMQHFANGEEIEFFHRGEWVLISDPNWNWDDYNYRIKKQKETIIIEKWLTYNKMYNTYSVLETSKIDVMGNSVIQKVKLLDSYEVEVDL